MAARRRRRTSLKLLQAIFFFCGLVALGFWGYSTLETKAVQAYEDWAFEQELLGREPTVWEYLKGVIGSERETTERKKPDVPEEKATPQTRPPVPDETWRARIQIPRVDIEAVVHHGVDKRTLSRAVGHIPGTAIPGQPGNVGLAAHRDTFFRGLRNIRKDDLIIIETQDGVFQYQVDSTRIVLPKRVDVLDATAEPTLTLVTCYPFNYVGKAPKRFIVHARQVTRSPVPLRGS